MGDGINKLWSIHTRQYYSAIKIGLIYPNMIESWKHFITERSQTQKLHARGFHLCDILEKAKPLELENLSVVDKGWKGEENLTV